MSGRIPQIDAIVVARAKRGDLRAQASIYEVFAPMVFTIARRMLGSSALAEDTMQETFVEIIRKVSSYRGDAEFGFWVRRIAINKCLMHLRSPWAIRRLDTTEPDIFLRTTGRNLAEDQIALERALDGLSATARAVVWLHDVEGHTHKEIGRLMGRSESFSKSQLARAHERLRSLLEGALEESGTQLCTPVLKIC